MAFVRIWPDAAIILFVKEAPASAKLILRDLVNATVGLGKSLHRMLSQPGNPSMSNILAVFAAIKHALKVEVHTPVISA